MNQKPNYGNWVPEKLLYLTFGGAALFLVLALLSGLAFSNTPLAVICAILCAVLLAFGIYMYACRIRGMHAYRCRRRAALRRAWRR